jgi:hypothetical protein
MAGKTSANSYFCDVSSEDVARSDPSRSTVGPVEEGAGLRNESTERPAMPVRKTKARTEPVSARLTEVVDRLKVMQSAVAVAVAALRAQNADIDEDVARMLIRAVSDPLQDQIDSIKSALRLLKPATSTRALRKR